MIIEHKLISLNFPHLDGSLCAGAENNGLIIGPFDMDNAGNFELVGVIDGDSLIGGHVDVSDICI